VDGLNELASVYLKLSIATNKIECSASAAEQQVANLVRNIDRANETNCTPSNIYGFNTY
jgi:hypothetical protein